MIEELNEANFVPTTRTAKLPVLVDFHALWCGPCRMILPFLETLADHFAGRIQFFKVDVDDAPEVAARFGVTAVPTLLLMVDGVERDRVVGFPSPGELLAKLEAVALPCGAAARAEAKI